MMLTRRQILAAFGLAPLTIVVTAEPAQARKRRRIRHVFPSRTLYPSRSLYPH